MSPQFLPATTEGDVLVLLSGWTLVSGRLARSGPIAALTVVVQRTGASVAAGQIGSVPGAFWPTAVANGWVRNDSVGGNDLARIMPDGGVYMGLPGTTGHLFSITIAYAI